jgi:hypothetical protein
VTPAESRLKDTLDLLDALKHAGDGRDKAKSEAAWEKAWASYEAAIDAYLAEAP